MDLKQVDHRERKRSGVISGTPLDPNLVLEQTIIYTSNLKNMNMERILKSHHFIRGRCVVYSQGS